MTDEAVRAALILRGITVDAGGLIHRTATITRSTDTDEAREFSGIGVPWGEVIEDWFGDECFDRGAVQDSDDALIFYGHRDAVGKVIAADDREAGYHLTGRISDTVLGRDVWTLVRDEVITKMSIGFEPIEYRVDEDDILHWTKVRAREFSLVPFPAYDGATVDPTTLRQATHQAAQAAPRPERTTMDPDDLTAISETLQDHQRALALLGSGATTGPSMGSQWRSMGDLLKSLASGDDAAAEFHRAYTGATTSDTVMEDTPVGDFIHLVQERRRLINDFTTGPLPADGLSIDYVKLKADTTQAAKQTNQGDDLAKGKVTLDKANAPVSTVGGWTELSRQAIERATVPALNITLRALAMKYAQQTNAMVATEYLAQIAARIVADATDNDAALDLTSTATVDNWLDAVVDAALIFEERGFSLDQLHVSGDQFKKLAHLRDGDHRLMNVYGTGVNVVGSMDLRQVDGSLANVPVRLLPGRSLTGKAAFSDKAAIEFLESAGAPAQLQDENIVNLSKSFSLYGYSAILVPFPTAILPIEFGA